MPTTDTLCVLFIGLALLVDVPRDKNITGMYTCFWTAPYCVYIYIYIVWFYYFPINSQFLMRVNARSSFTVNMLENCICLSAILKLEVGWMLCFPIFRLFYIEYLLCKMQAKPLLSFVLFNWNIANFSCSSWGYEVPEYP